MFFVAKDKIGTTLGAQKEYTACTRRGIGFASHGNAWHYLWPTEMIEPSIRSRFEQEDSIHSPEPTHYLWSQAVAPGELIGEPVIHPFSGESDWIEEARRRFIESQQQH